MARENETEYAWVGKEEWKVIGTVDFTKDGEMGKEVDLVVDGVDTCASITFNGIKIADVCNAHR